MNTNTARDMIMEFESIIKNNSRKQKFPYGDRIRISADGLLYDLRKLKKRYGLIKPQGAKL